MTWIRFGRNEPPAPAGPLRDADGGAFDLRAYGEGGALLVFFPASSSAAGCAARLEDLAAVDAAEEDARSLVVLSARAEEAVPAGLRVAYDEGRHLLGAYRGLLEFDAGDGPLLFVLDRDGAPVCAWVGACEGQGALREELARRLQSAAFLCPECSVPDPAASAMWDVTY
jgi:hypothetical protein